MLFAEELSAQRALELGVVNAIPQRKGESATELATAWANVIASKSSVATRAIKEAVAGIFRPDQVWLDLLQLELSRRVTQGGHLVEGVNAFFQKRAPEFS